MVRLLFSFFIFQTCIFQLHGQASLVVHFENGKAELSQIEIKKLDSLIIKLETELQYKVRLVGHTDSIGDQEQNQKLSELRTIAIQKFLSKSKRIVHYEKVGKSYLWPAKSNDTDAGRAENRRCELYIEPIQTKAIPLHITVQEYSFQNSQKVILHTKRGCKIIVESGSFAIKNHDTVTIQITEFNDPADFIAGGLPMSYEHKEKTYLYQSEQMMKLEAFVGSTPVTLVKLVGLDCPNVDTTQGVRFYEFKSNVDPLLPITPKLEKGTIEILKVNKQDVQNKNMDALSKINPEKKNTKHRFTLKPDTSKGFVLNPDTGWEFILKPDTGYGYPFYGGRNGLEYIVHFFCNKEYCDISTLSGLSNIGLQYQQKPFTNSSNLDFHSYFQRYKSLSYDGMRFKCLEKKEDLYKVKLRFKWRWWNHSYKITFTSFPENPEYKPLFSSKWILSCGNKRNRVEEIKNNKISDFRIFQNSDNLKEIKYHLELKSDSSFYTLVVSPKKRKLTDLRFNEYFRRYENRVISFNDSIKEYLHTYKLNDLYCLYKLTDALSKINLSYCAGLGNGPCLPFSFFNTTSRLGENNSWSNECKDTNKVGEAEYFSEWLEYYTANRNEFLSKLQTIKDNPQSIQNCMCPALERLEDEPCIKWVHDESSSVGKSIIYIGLGIYNFDRVMALEKKIVIPNAIYLNEEGDTLLRCTFAQSGSIAPKKKCSHRTITVIPGFNGLLEQNRPEILQLLPGKENILLFMKFNKRYKLYLDLRNKDNYEGNIFVLEDITEKTNTLEGLREELTRE